MADAAECPTVSHVIVNAVCICTCPAKIVMVLNVIGGEVQCTSCKRKWRSPRLEYAIDYVTKVMTVKCITEEVPRVNIHDRFSIADLDPSKRS